MLDILHCYDISISHCKYYTTGCSALWKFSLMPYGESYIFIVVFKHGFSRIFSWNFIPWCFYNPELIYIWLYVIILVIRTCIIYVLLLLWKYIAGSLQPSSKITTSTKHSNTLQTVTMRILIVIFKYNIVVLRIFKWRAA